MRDMVRDFESRVYFVQSGEDGPIKIGYARDLYTRLHNLQAGNPVQLRWLADIPGGIAEEKALHLRFDAYRIRGEWFEPTAELLALIADALVAKEAEDDVRRHRLAAASRLVKLPGS